MSDETTQDEVAEILLDVWTQFACTKKPEGFWAGGLSTLESVESYLRKRGRLDEQGRPVWQTREVKAG